MPPENSDRASKTVNFRPAILPIHASPAVLGRAGTPTGSNLSHSLQLHRWGTWYGGLVLADQIAAPAFERGRVAAQYVGFGENADDAAVEIGIDHPQRLGFGAVERQHRLFYRHAGQQHVVGVLQQ